MTRLFYSMLMWLAQPLLRRKLARRGVMEAGYLHAMDERFGYFDAEAPAHDGKTVWVHAVSLGETRAAARLVERLRESLPGMRLLLTHGTATGRAEGENLLQPGDLQSWQPWDTPAATARFLKHFRPRIGILMETEIWPNLAAACTRAGVPLVLANARLSEKSLNWSNRLGWLARPAYRSLTAVWAQTQDDAARLASLGASVQGVFGNIKFDATPEAGHLALGRVWHERARRATVMFASSREGEEATLLQILSKSQPLDPVHAVQWLIVPRHPQRFDEVAALIEQHGFAVSRRSHWRDGPPAEAAGHSTPPTLWLGDTLGEMAIYYALADVALLGGSFEPLGGQNLIEASACDCPVVMGPHTFNFAEAAELASSAGAALRVGGLARAVSTAAALVQNRQELQAARQAAALFASAHRGATGRLVDAIALLLDSRKP
jgi:3-deoxy-D-manno-octulosonic-acid transferase